MCACEPGYVCSRCAGDPQQDYRELNDDAADDADAAARNLAIDSWLRTLRGPSWPARK